MLLNDGTGSFNGYTDFTSNYPGDLYYGPDTSSSPSATSPATGTWTCWATTPSQVELPLCIGDGTGAFTYNRIYRLRLLAADSGGR